jgi:hypothetical protein
MGTCEFTFLSRGQLFALYLLPSTLYLLPSALYLLPSTLYLLPSVIELFPPSWLNALDRSSRYS